jgi:Txe/YoeB family toxin of Txe-Axe toxin-antitoxin module
MEMAWSLHKLANLLDIEGNLRLRNSQIVQATYQLSKHSRIRKKITLLITIFHIDPYRIIY